jgi:multidrug efflux pump subunit AcrA (membrane-fusion protein)
MNRTWRILIIILLVLIGIGAGVYYYTGRRAASQEPAYQVVTVQRGTVVSKVTTTGTISPNRQVALTFRSAGTVAEVLVQPGDRVKEGQLLARLDDRDYQLAVEQAESALEISKLQLAKAEAGPSPEDIAAARASVESAEASLKKLKQGPTPQEITVAKSSLEQARIALQQAQAAYDKVAWVGGVGA